ncbi:ATP-binding protein [Halorubrum halophilum]|uniref:ATP-binding protein n=1 Tax=Halorubrum halophilum TaxID=413816 RepID=UPI000678DBAA|nr:ATP-binding protein [Halorubrum halophilum]
MYTADSGSPVSIGVPLDRQRRHIAHIAAAGTGKTITAQRAVLSNMQATDGIDIVVDPKGGFADGFLPMAYHETGTLEDVTVITASTEMLRLPLWDLRPFLDADLDIGRSRLIEIVVNAGMEVLKSAADSPESFESAGQSLELIQTLLTASFRAGADTVSLQDLLERLGDVENRALSLSVSDPLFAAYLEAETSADARTRRAIVGGARRRLAPLIRDELLANAVGTPPDDPTHQFDVVDALDRDAVIIIDTAGLDAPHRELIIRTITARVFAAGRLRQLDQGRDDQPLANIYLDEAHVLGDSDVLLDLLSEGRAFGISLYLMSQELAQFGEEAQSHIETNVGTVLTAQSDTAMAHAIARGPYSARQAEHLVGRIPAGDWLVRFRPHRGHAVPDPFVISAGALPQSHPEHPEHDALSPARREACADAIDACRTRSRNDTRVVTASTETPSTTDTEKITRGLTHTLWLPAVDIPPGATYDDATDTLRCADCGEEFLVSFPKLRAAIRHCEPDIDLSTCDLPITEIGLETVTTEAIELCPLSITEVMFLRLVERARRRAIDHRAWDVRDQSMYPLRAAVGLTGAEPKEALVEAGYITLQSDLQGDYYNLTSKARTLLERLRNGGDPPEPKRGDPAESVLHIKGVELAAQALETGCEDPDLPIEEVERYWVPPESEARIDVVGLDADGQPRVCVEVERSTHDLSTGVLEDADAMAACDPDASIWVVTNRSLGHTVVDHLASPASGRPRIDLDPADLLSPSTALAKYDLTAPGCSAVMTYGQLNVQTIRDAFTPS